MYTNTQIADNIFIKVYGKMFVKYFIKNESLDFGDR